MIVVLGGNGYIGSRIVQSLETHRISVRNLGRSDCNYYDPDSLSDAIGGAKFLVNAAGYTGRPNVDACEQHKAECLLANAVLPGIVRDACDRVGLPWIHVSSGCIYTGTSPTQSGFREIDSPNFCFRTNNCSFYSGSKALGEELVRDAKDCYVLRLRIPFERRDNSRNYISKLLRYDRLLNARNSLTFLDEFVSACVHCYRERPIPGTYNITNTGSVTTREVVELLHATRVTDKTFDFFESEEEFMQVAAKTPRSNCALDNRKALDAGFSLSNVGTALETALNGWQPELMGQNESDS